LNKAQQNYPVHEIEMLAGVETMLCHCDILQGCSFCWYTDHKALVHLLNQKNLSGCQACWMERIAEFNYEIIYLPGTKNAFPDALSCLYSNDAKGTVRVPSKYTQFDSVPDCIDGLSKLITMPLLVRAEANATVPLLVEDSQPHCSRRWAPVPPAETGHPEISHKFASRMKGNFEIVGPCAH
jgi:hypothetical protein